LSNSLSIVQVYETRKYKKIITCSLKKYIINFNINVISPTETLEYQEMYGKGI